METFIWIVVIGGIVFWIYSKVNSNLNITGADTVYLLGFYRTEIRPDSRLTDDQITKLALRYKRQMVYMLSNNGFSLSKRHLIALDRDALQMVSKFEDEVNNIELESKTWLLSKYNMGDTELEKNMDNKWIDDENMQNIMESNIREWFWDLTDKLKNKLNNL